jgi:hypothetical protein
LKQLFIVPISENECVTHDGYIQIGIFDHSVEKHIELSNAICGDDPINWQETYWMPDPFCIRYKRASFQRTEKMNEGSPRTDNAMDSRPRDFPDQPTERLERTL